MRFLYLYIIAICLWSCNSNKPHEVNGYFANLENSLKVDTIRYSSGEVAMIAHLHANNRLEGYAKSYFGNGDDWLGYYFKNGSPCYTPDLLADLKKMEYSINTDTSEVLTVGDTFELRFWHDELMPFFVDFEVTNAVHEVQYENAWSLFLIPTGGECQVKATVWFRSLPPFPFFDHVFKTKRK